MKFTFPLNNFTSGVWSPKMYGRTDTDQYLKACAELKNFFAQVHGGAQYRAGFALSEILLETTQAAYDTGLTDPDTNAFKLIPYDPFNSSNATILSISQVDGQFHMLPSGNAPSLPLSFYGAWNPEKISYVQLGDYLVLADGDGINDPHVFFYNTSLGIYQLNPLQDIASGSKYWKAAPWDKLVALDNNNTMTVTGTMTVGGSVTITASSLTAFENETGYFMRFCNSSKRAGVVLVTTFATGAIVQGVVYQAMPEASGFVYASEINTTSFWQRHSWSTGRGFPRTVTAFQGRLIFGGSAFYPDTVWGSRISDYIDFEEVPEPNTTGVGGFASGAYTSDNTRPFALTPNSPEASNIVALSTGKSLNIHTEKSEIVAYGSNGALGPVNVTFDSSTSFGAKQVPPVRVNNFSTFVQKGGLRLRDIIFSFNEDQYKSSDLSFVADHLLIEENVGYTEFAEIIRFEGRSSYLVARTTSGKILFCTLDRDYQVNAWSEVKLGYTGDASYTFCLALVESRGALWALIQRPVGAGVAVSFERMPEPWEVSNPYNNAVLAAAAGTPMYLDGGFSATATAIDGDGKSKAWNVSGANNDWFADKTVSVVADGNYIGDIEVDSSSNFTTSIAYTSVYIGYVYEGVIKTLPIETGAQTGSPLGRIKRIDEAVVKFLNTNGVSVGNADRQDELTFRTPDQPMNEATDYFTGDKVITFPANYTRAAQVVIKQNMPYPAYIVSVGLRGQTFEG